VWGGMDLSIVGGGRPMVCLPEVKQQRMEEYVKLTHSAGLKFTYLLNGACMGNMEYNAKVHKDLLQHLGWVEDINVDEVTVTIPYLMELIKEQFPKIRVKVSTISHVNSVNRAKYYEALGADTITLDFMINRDFGLLKAIRDAVGCDLEIIVNDCCLYQCPYRYYHYNLCAHASQSISQTQGWYIDYCCLRCTVARLSSPKEIMKARWIRPEDLNHYEEIGIDFIKVDGRRFSTPWILNAVKAYASKRYDGNLLDILDGVVFGPDPNFESPQYMKYVSKADVLNEDLTMWNRLPPFKGYLNNSLLDGFLDYFKRKDCLKACAECDYCERWAKKVIAIDEESKKMYLDACNRLIGSLVTGTFIASRKVPITEPLSEKRTSITLSLSSDLRWNDNETNLLQDVIAFAPSVFRETALKAVLKAAEGSTRERKSLVVGEEDVVKAFLSVTPKAFYPEMLLQLEQQGIDMDEYKEHRLY